MTLKGKAMSFEHFASTVVCMFAAFGFFVLVLLGTAWACCRLHIGG